MATSPESSFKESLELLNYTDFSYRGAIPGSPFVLKQELAIKNSIKMYLFSQRGDYGRNISKGGPLIEFIGKPIDNMQKEEIRKRIISELSKFSNIVLNEVNVEGVPEKKIWRVQIIFSDTFNKLTDSVNYEMGGGSAQ